MLLAMHALPLRYLKAPLTQAIHEFANHITVWHLATLDIKAFSVSRNIQKQCLQLI